MQKVQGQVFVELTTVSNASARPYPLYFMITPLEAMISSFGLQEGLNKVALRSTVGRYKIDFLVYGF